jgi:hypothetical protein
VWKVREEKVESEGEGRQRQRKDEKKKERGCVSEREIEREIEG